MLTNIVRTESNCKGRDNGKLTVSSQFGNMSSVPSGTNGMRIAHISDLHLSARHQRRTIRNSRRVLEHIARLGVDHLVVTGDLTADARPEDFQLARNLFAAYDFLDVRRLTVIPGNHDIFGGVHDAEDILTFPGRCRETDYAAALRLFQRSFAETFGGVVTKGGAGFPFAKAIGDVCLFGVNSIAGYSRVKNPLGSNGSVPEREREALAALLADPLARGRTRIILIHHHFNRLSGYQGGAMHTVWGAIERHTMRLRKKKKLLELFRTSGVDLVLHGHQHCNCEYLRGGIRFVNAGGSIMVPAGGPLSAHMIGVSRGTCTVGIHAIAPVPESSPRPTPFRNPAAAGHIAA
jgi:3',5'-cyclic-AMP phosphodiesterase